MEPKIYKIEELRKASFQVGVDVLGFPVYHEHTLVDVHTIKKVKGYKGKNLSKIKDEIRIHPYIFSNQVKQN